MESKNVVILGASDKTDRYSFKALKMLIENGHTVFPVNPTIESIDGIAVYKSILDIDQKIHTITIYMRPERWGMYLQEIIRLKPVRVICNPGTESSELEKELSDNGIECLEACTLVLLRSNRF
jgi:predicted CoA-binding protein